VPAAGARGAPTIASVAAPAAAPRGSKQAPAAPRLPATAILDAPPLRIPRAREDGGAALAAHTFRSFPEDTLFYHRALALGAALARVPQPVIVYRYSEGSQSWRIPRRLLLAVRVALFEERVLGLRRRRPSVAAVPTAERERGGHADGAARREAAAMSKSGTDMIGEAAQPHAPATTAAAAAEAGASASCCSGPPGAGDSLCSSSTVTGTSGVAADCSADCTAVSCSSSAAAAIPAPFWDTFTIWGAGRDGKAFYGALSDAGKRRVAAFCDLDARKIGQRYPPPLAQPRAPKVPKLDKAARATARAAAAAMLQAESTAAEDAAVPAESLLAAALQGVVCGGGNDADRPPAASMDVIHSGTGASAAASGSGTDAAPSGSGGSGEGHAPAAKRRRLSDVGADCVAGTAGLAAGDGIVLETAAALPTDSTPALPTGGALLCSACRACDDAAAGCGCDDMALCCGCQLSRSRVVSSAAPAGLAATRGSAHRGSAATTRSQAVLSGADAASLPPHPRGVPIVHFSAIQPPAVICVALGSGGRGDDVRRNVASVRGLVEGQTAWFFV
jgi:hypothetical protein